MSEPITVKMRQSPRAIYRDGKVLREIVRESGVEEERDPEQYLSGYQAGSAEWARRFAPLIAQLESKLQEVEVFRTELMLKLEEKIVDVALAVAHKLLHQEISEGRHRASEMIRSILGCLDSGPNNSRVAIRLHPDDHAQILQMSVDNPDESPEWGHVEFEPDENMPRASFSIDSEFGHLLYDVDQQLREIEVFLHKGESI